MSLIPTYLRRAEGDAVDLEMVVVLGEDDRGQLGDGPAQRVAGERDAVDAVQVDLFSFVCASNNRFGL